MTFNQLSLRTKIVLLLAALFLFQSVCAALEVDSAAVSTADDPHHTLSIVGGADVEPAENSAQDTCDNCCHCHGSHLSLLATTLQIYYVVVTTPPAMVEGDTCQVHSPILRPPIA